MYITDLSILCKWETLKNTYLPHCITLFEKCKPIYGLKIMKSEFKTGGNPAIDVNPSYTYCN